MPGPSAVAGVSPRCPVYTFSLTPTPTLILRSGQPAATVCIHTVKGVPYTHQPTPKSRCSAAAGTVTVVLDPEARTRLEGALCAARGVADLKEQYSLFAEEWRRTDAALTASAPAAAAPTAASTATITAWPKERLTMSRGGAPPPPAPLGHVPWGRRIEGASSLLELLALVDSSLPRAFDVTLAGALAKLQPTEWSDATPRLCGAIDAALKRLGN